jgi:hypothetical protein
VSGVCCQGEGSALGLSPVQRGVLSRVVCLAECDREASKKGRPWHTTGCCVVQIKVLTYIVTTWCLIMHRNTRYSSGVVYRDNLTMFVSLSGPIMVMELKIFINLYL